MTHLGVDRWTLYNLEATAKTFDALENSRFELAIMKEQGPESYTFFKSEAYDGRTMWRTVSVCPFDLRRKDPRQTYVIGVKAPANSRYDLQFRHTESLIPLNQNFTIETYGRRYLYFTRTAFHQANYSYMWIDIKVEQGKFETIGVMNGQCPKLTEKMSSYARWGYDYSSYTVWGPGGKFCPCNETTLECDSTTASTSVVANGSNATTLSVNGSQADVTVVGHGLDPNDHPCARNKNMTYRIEMWDCSSDVGEYILMIDTRGEYFKGTAYAYVQHNDHRCQTIVPPLREEILVTFGEVVKETFPIVVGGTVFLCLLFLVIRYCYKQAMVNAQHRKRMDKEKYDQMDASEYFGEEKELEEENQIFTRKARVARSAFQIRKERETRIEKALIKAQAIADGYDDGEFKATY